MRRRRWAGRWMLALLPALVAGTIGAAPVSAAPVAAALVWAAPVAAAPVSAAAGRAVADPTGAQVVTDSVLGDSVVADVAVGGAGAGGRVVGGSGAAPEQIPRVSAPDSPVPAELDGTPYRAIRGRRATVHFAERDALVAERVRDLLDGQPALPGLPADLPDGAHVVLAHTPAAFDAMTGGVVPEWRAGVAIPSLNTIVMPTGEGVRVVDGEGLRTLRHEWAHLGLSGYVGDLRIPRWFNEGYAQWASGGFEAMDAWRLRVLIARGRAPEFEDLALRWPSGREEARTAYLLAASAVTYVLHNGGEDGLALFLERWRDGRSFDAAFRQTFGVTLGQFEEDWRRHVKERYGWLFMLSHSAVFWMLLALVLLFMVRGRQTRNREKLARLRAGELPDAPAWWDPTAAPGDDVTEEAP